MSINSERYTPHLEDPARVLYERAYRSGNTTIRATIELDTMISRLQRQSLEQLEQSSHASGAADFALDALNESAENFVSWSDYYRLLGRYALVDPLIQVEAAFRDTTAVDARKQLTDGIAGENVAIIEHALRAHDNPRSSRRDQDELRGVINENLYMALVNYDQIPNRLALPTSLVDDMYRKTDVNIYHIEPESNQAFRANVQIKSSRFRDIGSTAPEGGFTVVATDFANRRPLYAARLLAREMNGYELEPDDQKLLDDVHAKIAKSTLELLQNHPGEAIS